ncbi:hypothetical protein COT97_04170 [Candidatus Falkowbacteria bacterium CG10_big_fil_rev_8_21_14_0_10_39_11]|uniref:Uncharacterized protein n=1 Tax=Candidatus Falkowbacteria bacterium CG10_big_fil_rev_8_21_14_0_10_39_11 TaxID=1974565 RepID=A0A2H0V493_9BACT|nr:MAG: hypothetical protein COT97_04170 [Candidatus Falkowbacteria bacterium CG10_big_fil_rev_8_21_14_0_10_39_11]
MGEITGRGFPMILKPRPFPVKLKPEEIAATAENARILLDNEEMLTEFMTKSKTYRTKEQIVTWLQGMLASESE